VASTADRAPAATADRDRQVKRQLLPCRAEHAGQRVDPDPGLHPGHQVTGLVLEHLVQPQRVDNQVAAARRAAPGQPGAGAARQHGEAELGRGAHDRARLGDAAGRGDVARQHPGHRVTVRGGPHLPARRGEQPGHMLLRHRGRPRGIR
jgi:hypothetical protein